MINSNINEPQTNKPDESNEDWIESFKYMMDKYNL